MNTAWTFYSSFALDFLLIFMHVFNRKMHNGSADAHFEHFYRICRAYSYLDILGERKIHTSIAFKNKIWHTVHLSSQDIIHLKMLAGKVACF